MQFIRRFILNSLNQRNAQRVSSDVNQHAKEDIKNLSGVCEEVTLVKRYRDNLCWYYIVPYDARCINTMQRVLAINGVRADMRYSWYDAFSSSYDEEPKRRMLLAVSSEYLQNNESANSFMQQLHKSKQIDNIRDLEYWETALKALKQAHR